MSGDARLPVDLRAALAALTPCGGRSEEIYLRCHTPEHGDLFDFERVPSPATPAVPVAVTLKRPALSAPR